LQYFGLNKDLKIVLVEPLKNAQYKLDSLMKKLSVHHKTTQRGVSTKSNRKPNYWLMKSEPDVYSIDDLKRDGKTLWEGVRNYQARNFMMHDMNEGDIVLFYHSNAKPPGIAGIAEVCGKAIPDPTAFDPKSEYYDPKSTIEKPIWFCVPVRFKEKLKRLIPIDELRKTRGLEKMLILQKGSRLSVTPVKPEEFLLILKISKSLE
jgi:predicted RNA-binding protein with PUA-like domain